MKMNPNIAKSPKDLEKMEFKKLKANIKRDLKRLEKNTSPDIPTQVLIIAEHDFTDKKAMPLLLFGAWKGEFKDYAKKNVATQNPLGAIGSAHFGGEDADGQKIIKLDLAKGKGKGKTAKLAKALRKLVPQATYNVVIGEMKEDALDKLEKKLDAAPESDEVIEAANLKDEGQVEVTDDKVVAKLLAANLKEIQAGAANIKNDIAPRIKARNPKEDDADTVIDISDLVDEWLELYSESSILVKGLLIIQLAQVKLLQGQISPVLEALKKLGVNPSNGKMIEDAPKTGDVLVTGNNPIKQSVGDNKGVNDPADVVTVQKLLIENGYANVKASGDCDDATKAAIRDYQKTKMNNPAPDGRVDAGGKTWKALNTKSSPTDPVKPVTPKGNNPIKDSVGDSSAANKPADVITIQELLVAKGYTNVTVSGNCDDATKAAIRDYQKTKMNNPAPDGRVDAGGKTWKSLMGIKTETGGSDYTGATKGFRPQNQQDLDWETETEREKKLEEFFDTFSHIKVCINPGESPAKYVDVVPSYEINSQKTKDPQGNKLEKPMDLAAWGDLYVTGKAGAIRKKLPWHAKAGKATPKDIEWFLNESVKQGATAGYELTNKGLRKYLDEKQVGVDCTGLVSQALNFLADGNIDFTKEDEFSITGSMTAKQKFKKIDKPSAIKAGDMMKLEKTATGTYGHVRVVVDVDKMPDGSVHVRTIESGGSGENSGVGATLWRYKNPDTLDGLERSDDNGGTWYGSTEHQTRSMTYQRWEKLDAMPE